jgi:hypothetical protein
MNTRALPLPGLPRGRHNRRALRRTPPVDSAGMSFGRLLGVALLGWFGLMMLVTALAL